MIRHFPRLSVAATVEFAGLGLHSGVPVRVRVHPGNAGWEWQDVRGRSPINPDAVTDTQRCTCLAELATIEHLMSALAGCGITDAVIEADGPECPGLDGSAQPYVQGLLEAGTVNVGSLAVSGPYARVFRKDDNVGVAVASGTGHWRYLFATVDCWPGDQVAEYLSIGNAYVQEIGPARTFCFEHELEWIKANGLGLGLDERSALVLGKDGPINAARFPDEPAKHKLLDLIGDLALAGVPITGLDVVAERSGHSMNVAAAARLAAAVTLERLPN